MALVDLLKLGPPVNNWRIEKVVLGDNIPTWVLGTGTADATTFLRGDLTWAPAGGAGNTDLALANLNNLTLDITSSTGTGVTLPEATTLLAGLLIASDKIKLNNTSGVNTGDETNATILAKIGYTPYNATNPAGYITGAQVPANETDPVFTAWLAGPPNVSEFTNDVPYLTAASLFITAITDTATINLTVTGTTLTADVIDNTNIQKIHIGEGGVIAGTKFWLNFTSNGLINVLATDDIPNDRVNVAVSSIMNTARLVGRSTAGLGVMEEITLGTGLSFTGTTLNVTFPSNFITAVSDTNSINLTVTGTTLSADVLIQNTATINLSIDASGLKADLVSLNISQFANDVPYLVAGDLTGYVQDTRLINTTAPLAGGGDLSADRTLTTSMATGRLIGRTTVGAGVMEEITPASNVTLSSLTLTPNPETYEYYFRTGTTRKRYDIGVKNGYISSGNSLLIPANRIVCAWRFYSVPRTIVQEAIYVIIAGTAAARATAYIYSTVNGYPSAKLHTFAEHNTSATTKKENTGLSVAITPGGYWFILHVNEQITIPGIDAYASQHPLGVAEPDNSDTRLQLFSTAYAYGAAPATFAETDFILGFSNFPSIGVIYS